MAFKSGLTTVRFYTAADPYFYSVDNRPLTDLASRDDALADELDRRTFAVDVTGQASPTINHVPSGWSVTRNGVGDYTINHGLSNANYIVTGIPVLTTGCVYLGAAPGANSFNIKTTNLAGTAADFRFNVLVTGY